MIKHILTLIWNKRRSNTLMLLEVFVAFLILFAIFTLAIHYLRMYSTPIGFTTQNSSMVLLMSTAEDSVAQLEERRLLRREVEDLPEVVSSSFISDITPFSGSQWTWGTDENGFEMRASIYAADDQYAETAELNLVEGRWFTDEDSQGKYPPVVITQSFREKYYQDKPIIDSILILGQENRIVGVVDNFKYRGEFEEEMPLVFLPITMAGRNAEDGVNMIVRTRPGTSGAFEAQLSETVNGVLKNRESVIQTLEQRRVRTSRRTWVPLVAGLVIGGFLIVNIALGLFGVLFYNISKRRAEIGLRRAIGASQGEITRQFTLEVFAVASVGMLLAVILAVQVPLLELLDIPPANFYWSILLTGLLISVVVLACAFLPSRQAAGVQPAAALHEE